METEEVTLPSLATDLIGKSALLIGISWVLVYSLTILRKKNCTAEINIIWYAFSLVFVLWWCLHFAMHLELLKLPRDENVMVQIKSLERELLTNEVPRSPSGFLSPAEDSKAKREYEHAIEKRGDDKRKLLELRRRHQEGEPWTGRYLYNQARKYLTDTYAELALVAVILLATIVPQLMNYVLAGLSGCAATPKYVWWFEKASIWSLIKFLAAFGGVFVADALGVYAIGDLIQEDDGREQVYRHLLRYFGDFVWGMGAVTLAFGVANVQVWVLEAAEALGKVWQENKNSWPYKLHKRFTGSIPRKDSQPPEAGEATTISPVQIWERLSLAQKQEVAALAMRSLLEGTLSAIGHSPERSTAPRADRSVVEGSPAPPTP